MKIANGKERYYEDWSNKNKDFYGRGCFNYAERWADLMEIAIEESDKSPMEVIIENAEELGSKADISDITDFMYDSVLAILTQCWEYGEELRQWHNNKYNYTGSGVINTSMITAGK